MTEAQQATVDRMLSAPAGGWQVTKTLALKHLSIGNVAVQIESPLLNLWGIIMPNGTMVRPKGNRKTIDAAAIANFL